MLQIITKKDILPISLIILSFAAGCILYPDLPESMPSHWNMYGQVDAWSGRNFSVFFFPSFTLVIYLLMIFIPLLDPLKKNYQEFRTAYFWIRAALVIFFTGLYLYTLWAALGTKLNINYFMTSATATLFMFIGAVLPKIKKNYFVGIRTPWTLHSEEVWTKTHQFSGKLFIAAGLVTLLGLALPRQSFLILMIAIGSAVLFSFSYSYLVFRKTQ